MLAGLAASVSFASEVVSAEGPAATAAAAGQPAPVEWERFVEAECSFNWSGELWREPAKVTVTFTEAETQAAFEAEVEAARREEFLGYLLEEAARRGKKGAIHVLSLCRVSGALGGKNLDEALRLADLSDRRESHYVRQVALWRMLHGGEEAPRAATVGKLARRLADAGYAEAADEIATAGARLLTTPEREEGRALLARAVELASDQPTTLAHVLNLTVRNKDAETAIDMVLKIEALGEVDDEKLKEALVLARTYAALRLGRFDLVNQEELTAELRRRFGPSLEWALGVAAGLVVVSAAWLAVVTRRREEGPGWWISATWAGLAPVGLSVIIFSSAWAAVTAALLLAAIVASLPATRRKDYFSAPEQARRLPLTVIGALLITYAVQGAYMGVLTWLDRAPQAQEVALFLVGTGWADSLMRFALFALAVPMIEEIAFRGYLLDVASRRMRRGWAIALVSLLFGLIHGWIFALPLAVFGACASVLREKHRSLWAPILLHVLNNAAAFIFVNLSTR